MCGIAGILTSRSDSSLTEPLERMKIALRHRGPDGEGQEEIRLGNGRRLGLVHTRLAILDLSPAGRQPMHFPQSNSWITYNGEIYNHAEVRRRLHRQTFTSTSDTETILAGWQERGEGLLPWLRGMFAFGLYDSRRRQFWLVRDRLGVKPLYVCRADAQTWLFASELRAILASGLCAWRLNAAAVESYLAFGAVAAPWTLIEGIESVLPGAHWCWNLDAEALEPTRTRYWRPTVHQTEKPANREEAVEALRPVLQEAVTLRMAADVPVGVFLSGGIDSSSLVAVLTHAGHRPRTFSIAFQEAEYDEAVPAREIANRFGTEHMELLLSSAEVQRQFDKVLAAYDQPSIDGFNTYFIAQAVRETGAKVALSGIGGDELFAGYSSFRRLQALVSPPARWLARMGHAVVRRTLPRSKRSAKLSAVLAEPSALRRHTIFREVLLPGQRRELIGADNGQQALPLPASVQQDLTQAIANADVVNAHAAVELDLYLGNMLLRDADQMGMAHGLEIREPFLDHVLVDTVLPWPGKWKLAPGRTSRTKGLLVDALPTPLPERVLRRRKMGFVFPWNHWLRGGLRPQTESMLLDAAAVVAAGLKPAGVRGLWNRFLASDAGVGYADILAVANLIHWVRQCRAWVAQYRSPSPSSAPSFSVHS